MNYIKLHADFIEYCKSTTPRERLFKRNPADIRLVGDYLYKESHHIIPKFEGRDDRAENLVDLLPEEHYLIHLIRYKAFKKYQDFKSVYFVVNGFISKASIDEKPFAKKIGLHRHFVSKFRLEHGWQTEKGRKSISVARKGTMPAKDAITGESVGSIDVNHPKVLSGEWIHHTKGFVSCIDETGKKIRLSKEERKIRNLKPVGGDMAGSKNPNFKAITPEIEQRFFALIPLAIEENHLHFGKLTQLCINEFTEFKKISPVWVRKFGTPAEIIKRYNKTHSTKYSYNRYFRFASSKALIAKAAKIQMTQYWESKRAKN
ncbi:HNH homing endonuclease [Yersinia phage vB_YenM_TG1]|uniref:HNH homing endonuclease n=1 Tax=Yersinia phage vB_YenM_TG1 TaxID=1589265 RepID=A0A0B4ZXJ9_9CAUD|nr:homing endonuclease [Yersinia phage vB_YenM_TG1]AJD82042.1 HNH homing endonuclease [Yersinia phage vB_YenM_TG1]